MDRPSRAPLTIGVILGICGWAVIFLGWYQAGRQEIETGQIPYVIIGGFGGFALLLMGVIAVLVDAVKQSEWKLRKSAEELHGRMQELAESFVETRRDNRRAPERPRAAAESATPAGSAAAKRPRRRRRRRPSGSSTGAAPERPS